MKKLFLLSFLLMALIANGRQIPESEAASVAAEFLNSATVKQSPTKAGVRRAKATNATNADTAPFYVYNAHDNQGFVIVSGDDRAKKILGYSDKGKFDFKNLPPQLTELLKQYGEQLKNIPVNTPTHDSWKTQARISEGGGVLLETANWGQGAPYNSECPIIDGVQAPTGCVATAMSIVMKYHNWPPRGRGIGKYRMGFEDQDEFYTTTDFSTFNFEWDIMQNNYENEDCNSPSAKAVASLMYAVGKGVNMIYNPTGSGAQGSVIGYNMARFFSYSSNFKHLYSYDYSKEEWFNIIKNEINCNRPVIYGLTSMAHEVVCDGYNDDLIHINWGWDGLSNE